MSSLRKWKLAIGQYDQDVWDGNEIEMNVVKIIKHPAYDKT